MSIRGAWPIRGYRPGRCAIPEEGDEQAESVRLANVEIYAKRASAGLPIFRDADEFPSALNRGEAGLSAT